MKITTKTGPTASAMNSTARGAAVFRVGIQRGSLGGLSETIDETQAHKPSALPPAKK